MGSTVLVSMVAMIRAASARIYCQKLQRRRPDTPIADLDS